MSQQAASPASSTSDYECPVCLHLLIAPTTLPCGHTVCLQCIQTAFERKRECPLCRQLCHSIPAVNIFIQNLVEKQFPEQYAQEKKELMSRLRKDSDEQDFLIDPPLSLIELPCIIEHNLLAAPKTKLEFRTLEHGYGEILRIQQQRNLQSAAFALLVDSDSGSCLTLELNRVYSQNLYGTVFYHIAATVTGRAQLMKVEEYPGYKIAFKAGVFPIQDQETREALSGGEVVPQLKEKVERVQTWFQDLQELIPRDQKYYVPVPVDATVRNWAELVTLQVLGHLNLEDAKGKILAFFSCSVEERLCAIEDMIQAMDGAAPERILDFTNPYKGPGSFQNQRKVPKICERLKCVLVLGFAGLVLAAQLRPVGWLF